MCCHVRVLVLHRDMPKVSGSCFVAFSGNCLLVWVSDSCHGICGSRRVLPILGCLGPNLYHPQAAPTGIPSPHTNFNLAQDPKLNSDFTLCGSTFSQLPVPHPPMLLPPTTTTSTRNS
jgi:hypothetical protein